MKDFSSSETKIKSQATKTVRGLRTPSAVTHQAAPTTITSTEEERARLDQEVDELFRKFDNLHKSLLNK